MLTWDMFKDRDGALVGSFEPAPLFDREPSSCASVEMDEALGKPGFIECHLIGADALEALNVRGRRQHSVR